MGTDKTADMFWDDIAVEVQKKQTKKTNPVAHKINKEAKKTGTKPKPYRNGTFHMHIPLCHTAQHHATQHSIMYTAQHHATQHSIMTHSTASCHTAQHHATQHSIMPHSTTSCHTMLRIMPHSTASCHTAQHHAAPHSIIVITMSISLLLQPKLSRTKSLR